MGVLKLVNVESSLLDELSYSPSVLGIRIDFLHNFLISRGIDSLSKVSIDTLKSFILHCRREFIFSKSKYSSYKGDLEVVIFSYMKAKKSPLASLSFAGSPLGRKCLVFLFTLKIDSLSKITAATRVSYEEYLNLSVPSKAKEYLKVLDLMVLSEIEKIKILRTPIFKEELFYLGYFPNSAIARRFYYTAKKEYLYFDFSIPTSLVLKKQIYEMLMHDLSKLETSSPHYFLNHFLTPLYFLYKYCIDKRIFNLKLITEEEADGFTKYLVDNMKSKYKDAPQVLYRIRKFLFLLDKEPDFNATLWFPERFLSDTRINPTREVLSFNFGDINAETKEYFQHFMKYLLTLSPRYSYQSIVEKYYGAKDFIKYLERNKSNLTELSYSDIEGFIKFKDSLGLSPETYNRSLTILSFFLTVLSVREKLLIPSFPIEYFYKKTYSLHKERSVKEETIDRILSVLPDFPETLGLMYLVLYSTGLRINEVCALKKDCLFVSNSSSWLRVYQCKLHTEKEIPIPSELYRLLKNHINKDTSGSIYIFPSCADKDKPYKAPTFTRQFKSHLSLYDETKDIVFKSHDYRHTIATDLYTTGAFLQTTRAFLGHTSEDMTKQYIDFLPGRIEHLQEEYFKENS